MFFHVFIFYVYIILSLISVEIVYECYENPFVERMYRTKNYVFFSLLLFFVGKRKIVQRTKYKAFCISSPLGYIPFADNKLFSFFCYRSCQSNISTFLSCCLFVRFISVLHFIYLFCHLFFSDVCTRIAQSKRPFFLVAADAADVACAYAILFDTIISVIVIFRWIFLCFIILPFVSFALYFSHRQCNDLHIPTVWLYSLFSLLFSFHSVLIFSVCFCFVVRAHWYTALFQFRSSSALCTVTSNFMNNFRFEHDLAFCEWFNSDNDDSNATVETAIVLQSANEKKSHKHRKNIFFFFFAFMTFSILQKKNDEILFVCQVLQVFTMHTYTRRTFYS